MTSCKFNRFFCTTNDSWGSVRAKLRAMDVQIFGTQKSQDTKKALRFFKERGVKPQFVDLAAGKTAPGELGRFVQKVGLTGLLDTSSRAYEDAGLEFLRLSDTQLLERMLKMPALLRQPLLRSGKVLAVGWDETLWKDLYAASRRENA